MLKVKSGDPDKMGLLFERYHRALYTFLITLPDMMMFARTLPGIEVQRITRIIIISEGAVKVRVHRAMGKWKN